MVCKSKTYGAPGSHPPEVISQDADNRFVTDAQMLLWDEGTEGPQGPQGPIGYTGAHGPIGELGPTGLTGATGPAGVTGATGATGGLGPAGFDGPIGPLGLTGAPGATGELGPKGFDGSVGPRGPLGLRGEKGDEGPINPNHGPSGQGQFMSMVFRRSATVPETPVGGNWGFPIPDGGLWTNTILPGTNPVFVTTRFFTNDGLSPQESIWRPPVLFVQHGSLGPVGPKGDKGEPGNPGIHGVAGKDGSAGVNGDAGTSIVWLGESASHPLNPEDGFSYKNTADKKSYVYWDGAWYQMTIDGFDGRSGLSHAIVSLFKTSPDASNPPATFTGMFTYTYATNALTEGYTDPDTAVFTAGSFNGWVTNFPNVNMGEYVWVRQASAVSENDTDPIAAEEFSGAVKLSHSGMDGLNSATVTLYNKNTSTTEAPTLPTGTFTYSFITYLLTGGSPNGWTKASPTIALGEHLWMIQATASSITDTDLIVASPPEVSEFSEPVIIAASGNNGLDIVWKGDLKDPPANPVKNWVYRDTDNHTVYIYNGSAWEMMVLDGSDGPEGAMGPSGLSVFIVYHDGDGTNNRPTPPTNINGTNNGWYTAPSVNTHWMSQKVDDGTGTGWGLAILIRSAPGPRGSNSFYIEESTAGTYTTPTSAANWAATTFSNDASAQNIARDVFALADDSSIRINDKITVTDVSAQIAGTRVYMGVPTNNYTTVLASHFSGLITEVIDGGMIVNGTISADALAADAIAGGTITGGTLTIGYSGIGGTKPPTNADATNYTDYRITNSQSVGGTLTIANPQGGTIGTSNQTGAIVIVLPQSWTNTMMKFDIDVYLYGANTSFTAHVGGYNATSSSAWLNTLAQITGSTASNNRIRFGHNGSKCCVVIGDIGSSWSYPKIAVKNFQAGHSNFAVSQWDTGWAVQFVTSLAGYTFTSDFTDALLDAKSIIGQGALATRSTADYATHISGTKPPADADKTSANKAMGIDRADTRDINSPPSYYYGLNRGTYSEFKTRTVIGAPGVGGYGSLTTDVPWGNSTGGPVIQTFSPGDNIYRRKSTGDTTWGDWQTIQDGADSTVAKLSTAVTEITSGGLKMTNTATGAYVQMTPGVFTMIPATTGARMEIRSDMMLVYDENGSLRVRLGRLF